MHDVEDPGGKSHSAAIPSLTADSGTFSMASGQCVAAERRPGTSEEPWRELNGVIPAAPTGCRMVSQSTSVAMLARSLTHEQAGDAAGELNHLDATLDFASPAVACSRVMRVAHRMAFSTSRWRNVRRRRQPGSPPSRARRRRSHRFITSLALNRDPGNTLTRRWIDDRREALRGEFAQRPPINTGTMEAVMASPRSAGGRCTR